VYLQLYLDRYAVTKCSVSQLMSWFSELTPSKQAGKREVRRVFISETEH